MLRLVVGCAAVLGLAAADAAAHGGQHPTPFPTGTPTPGTNPSGGTRPPRGAVTNSRGQTRWEEWWSVNRWNHLRIRRRAIQTTGKPGEEVKFADTPGGKFLLECLKDSHYDTRSAACIALGKAGTEAEIVPVRSRAFDKHHEVRESALLGLALLRADLRKADVLKLLADRTEQPRLRAMAALALGLSRDPASATPLLDLMRANQDEEEVRGAAALALGLLGETNVIVELQRVALNTGYTDVIRANAVAALGQLAKIRRARPAVAVPGAADRKSRPEPDSLEALTLLFRRWLRGDNRKAVRRAALLAFGTVGDESHLGEVLRAMKVDNDDMVQRLAMITAAKLAKGTGQAPYVQRQLSLICTGSGRMEGKGFAAVALGLLGEREGGTALIHVFKSGRHQSLRGAGAIGLGLLQHAPAVDLLLAEATGRGNPTLRAQATIALGMIGAPKAIAPLRTMLAETNRPQIKAAAAAGLALSGLPQDVKGLTALLKEKNAYVRMSAVQALGVLRDDLAIEPLIAHFKSESGPEIRALTVVSVGNILARRPVSAFQELAQHVNYLLRMPSLQQAIRLQ